MNEILTAGLDLRNGTLLPPPSFNTFEKLSDSEIITMKLPNTHWNETYSGSSEEVTHVITLSHLDDTVYLMSVYNMPLPFDDEKSETDHSTKGSMVIVG